MTDIKPIETVYQGYRMRSRLEARWACFFNEMGFKWRYEEEGYKVNGAGYLPDFFLPDLKCFVEIKGQDPTAIELQKCVDLNVKSNTAVYLLSGSVGMISDDDHWPSYRPDYVGYSIRNGEARKGWVWTQCLQCRQYGLVASHDAFTPKDVTRLFCDCYLKFIDTPLWGGDSRDRLTDYLKYDLSYCGDNFLKAYTAARQARFEHGENGNQTGKKRG